MLVQKLRLQHGWSQEHLAELSGLSVRTIQRIERGQTPSTESLKALGAVFNVDFLTLRETDTMTSAPDNITKEELLALWKVRKIRGFYVHLVQFLVTASVLLAANVYTYRMTHFHSLWAVWIALGWGSGVAIHGLKVFERVPFLNANWEKRQVEKYLGRPI